MLRGKLSQTILKDHIRNGDINDTMAIYSSSDNTDEMKEEAVTAKNECQISIYFCYKER